jgi:thiamine pyrophosphokinase
MFGNISIFSYNKESIISIKNLQYELDNYKLTNSFPLGVSNSFIGKEAKIEIKEGKILVVVSKTFLNKEEQK